MQNVTCSECRYFLPDQVGFGQGIGMCSELENYKKKLKQSDISNEEFNRKVDVAEYQIGILPKIASVPVKLLYPMIKRSCQKFLEK